MGRNNADFQNSALYHGTIHPFSVGDVVTPRGVWGDGYAWATPNVDVAKRRGEDHVNYGWSDAVKEANKKGELISPSKWEAENPPRVYIVEPVDADEAETTEHGHARSRKGFRVTGEHNGA